MQLIGLLLSLLLLPLVVGIAASDGPPDKVDRSQCENTPTAQGNFMLKVVVPALNKLIECVEGLYYKVKDLDPDDEAGGIPDDVRAELKKEIVDEVQADVREEVRRATADAMTPMENGTAGLTASDGADGATADANEGEGSGPQPDMMEDVQKLGPLLQSLDSRAAENLADEDLADPEALRNATDDELRQIKYVSDTALEKIRDVYPHEE